MSDNTTPSLNCVQCGNPLNNDEFMNNQIMCDRCWEVRSDYLRILDYDEFDEEDELPLGLLAKATPGKCRACGCTAERGCYPVRCYWAEPDLCSNCTAPPPDEARLNFGSCCACGRAGDSVRNLMMLDFTAPVPGTGWGCFQCGLPMDGATTVLCDDCLEAEAEIKFVIDGQPLEGKRLPIEEARARAGERPFNHNLNMHPEVTGGLN